MMMMKKNYRHAGTHTTVEAHKGTYKVDGETTTTDKIDQN